ncbi:type II toxin-antitoxin system VapC family toxin [Larkinella rosea]|uniref:Type II toxin-antitoxin system VapC family toxin n=1 Tax=Larkinella rosea TaxID=2025312 RepID=A0A3P1C2E6_9BACT|nr:type II toxin-antitoxin system VapC family toxin [Larkinella rosea]RRB07419.1 type II toxin-antitoxin system VapC family toxin [Larkinella rosea]
MIVDTNIIIYSIQPEFGYLRDYLGVNQQILRVPVISKIERLGFHKLYVNDKEKFEEFFQIVSPVALTDKIINEAIRLRQQLKRSLGDSIIAATALLHDLPILTNNTIDFADISGLQVISLQSIS